MPKPSRTRRTSRSTDRARRARALQPRVASRKGEELRGSGGWDPRPNVSFQVVAYRSGYRGIVQEVSGVPCPRFRDAPRPTSFRTSAVLELQGLQAVASGIRAAPAAGELHLRPSARPGQGLRVGDIASHRVNVIGGDPLLRRSPRHRAALQQRLRPQTGKGTTVDASPFTSIADLRTSSRRR